MIEIRAKNVGVRAEVADLRVNKICHDGEKLFFINLFDSKKSKKFVVIITNTLSADAKNIYL